jgi:hypothetical protein
VHFINKDLTQSTSFVNEIGSLLTLLCIKRQFKGKMPHDSGTYKNIEPTPI